MDQLPVHISAIKQEILSFERFKLITDGDTYFTVEDTKNGHRAYFQVNRYGHKNEPKYYRNYEVSTVHKPNKLTGSSREFRTLPPDTSLYVIVSVIIDALMESKRIIESGREQMDDRYRYKPNLNRSFECDWTINDEKGTK
jgi:hypothetical protein